MQIIQALISEKQLEFNRSTVGKTIPILLQKNGKKDGQIIGKSPYMQSVFVENPGMSIGSIMEVFISAGHQNSLAGSL